MQGKHLLAIFAVAALLPMPALANPTAKKQPTCQVGKTPTRDGKKVEPCRRQAPIPWVVDPTPLFLASTAPMAPANSRLS